MESHHTKIIDVLLKLCEFDGMFLTECSMSMPLGMLGTCSNTERKGGNCSIVHSSKNANYGIAENNANNGIAENKCEIIAN